MKYYYILFLLFNIFTISISITSRYIDFTGKSGYKVNSNSSGSSFLMYFYAEITGFTREYSFIMNTPGTEYQRYSYMTCTVPASTSDPSSYVLCIFDLEKFYLLGYTVTLPNEFPYIDDCQVSYWEKVSKSVWYGWYYSGGIRYGKDYRPSLITEPLCYYNTNKNIIKVTGGLYNSQSYESISKYSLSVPAFIDDKEARLDCSLEYKNGNWEYNCIVPEGKKLTTFYTIVHYSGVSVLIKLRRDFDLINCQNPDRLIRFLDMSTSCPTDGQKKNLPANFNAHIFGFNAAENFNIYLDAPSYAYLECTIPKSPITTSDSSVKTISCILDLNKFPLYSYRKITLPSSFPNINCEITYWSSINKVVNIGVCFPTLSGEISPQEIHGPECIKEDYNMLILSMAYSFSFTNTQTAHSFDLNVLINGKNDVIPCEFFTGGLSNNTYYPMYCYSNKGNANISFFETTITLENTKTIFVGFKEGTTINLGNCLVNEKKVIYFTSIQKTCAQVIPNQYYVSFTMYSKINGFRSEYSFNLYLDCPSNYYINCIIPASQAGLQKLTYIQCKLDLLRFPLINQNKLTLPSDFTLEETSIYNWESLIKSYDCSSCNPKYSVGFSAKQYIETSCYKPHYNKIFAIGQISSEDYYLNYYLFKMNAIVDDKLALLPCELKSLKENYQLECITNGNNTVSIFNTFVTDDNTKQLIYIEASNQYKMKECNPTKIIAFTKIESSCSPNDSLFKIYFYANMEGFTNEEKIKIYLEQPEYSYMECTIPQSKATEKYIYCSIDVNRFPLISTDKIILPDEFYIHPEWEINDWEKMHEPIPTKSCSTIYQYSFNSIKYFDTECYLNGYNSFIAEGTFEAYNNENIKDLNYHTITFDALADSEYHTISCEIYLPDVSSIYSRIYCYSIEVNNVKIFPIVAQDKNSNEKILININHIYEIKNCPTQNKMIYFKGIESECSLSTSILKILIYSDTEGFDNEEKLTINLEYPNLSYMNCNIPKSNSKRYIECNLDISKFPVVSKDTIKLPNSFPQSNCYISSWKNINKELNTGKCYPNYSLIFSPSKLYESKCYDKNYNAIALLGSLSIKGNMESEISQIYSFMLNSIVDGNYDNILCEIYPPDESFSEHRMFCYTNKIKSIKTFQTISKDINNQENIYINIPNYNLNLIDCSTNNKLIYFKGINLKYTESFVNILFYGNINGITKEETFLISLDEPNYSYIICLIPFSENYSEDRIIECKYDIKKFPLVKQDKIKFSNVFPKIQDYSLSNWDFINKELYIGYQHQNYTISFIAHKYVDAICYKMGYNVFSAVGSIELNNNNIGNNEIFEFNNYVIIDGKYIDVSCKIYPIISSNNDYQMDCYTNGTSTGILFPTISSEIKTYEFIFIDSLHEYKLQNCNHQIKRTINFQGNSQPQCTENGTLLMLSFSAKTSGFIKKENITIDVFNLNNNYSMYMNCIIPVSRNGEDITILNCYLDTKIFPLINMNQIRLPLYFPKIENCETSNWSKITLIFNVLKCHQPYEMIFTNLAFNEQNCKSKNEAFESIVGFLKNADGTPITSQNSYIFTLSAIIDNYIKEVTCELYPLNDNSSNYYQMDCNLETEHSLILYGTIAQDEVSQKYIFIEKSDYDIFINKCTGYNKFINLNGNLEMKCNSESSQLELFLYSQIVGLEKEETLIINLNYPIYSYIECMIPSSKLNNNTFLKCILDTKKFPLNQEDSIILPYNLRDENFSITKWKKLKKELKNIDCTQKYKNVFYSDNNQKMAKCDDNGNNIITISGSIDPNQTNTQYKFDILGIVDSQYKLLNCSLDVKKENNQIICLTKGNISSQIFKTTGTDYKTKEEILIKVNDYLDYNLTECFPVSSSKLSTFSIVLIVSGCLILVLIAFLLIKRIRKNKGESKQDTKLKSLINELDEISKE